MSGRLRPPACDTGGVADVTPLQGELQTQVMSALWRLGTGTVQQVHKALPSRYRGAYNTTQTVLNRLAERGLLSRKREGIAIVYKPKVTEAEYLASSIEQTLSAASADARQVALAQLIGGMDSDELSGLQELAKEISSARKGRRK